MLLKNPSFSIDKKNGYLSLKKVTANNELLYLIYQDGIVWAKNPSSLVIAGSLDGRVRGDNLEIYRTPNETYAHPNDYDLIEKNKKLEIIMLLEGGLYTFIYFFFSLF